MRPAWLAGESRSRLPGLLEAPHTTTRLSVRSGLVGRNRQGREVMYQLTDAGRALVATRSGR